MISKNKTTGPTLGKGFLTPSLRNESGAALIMALLFMLVMVSLMPLAMNMTSEEVDRSGKFQENREAFFVAEAGLEHGKALIEQTTFRRVLAGPDDAIHATPSNAANDDNGAFNGIGTVTNAPDGLLSNQVTFGSGRTYYIRARDNDDGDGNPEQDSDNMIILSAMGVSGDTSTTVETTVYNPPGIPVGALTINGDLQISGNPNVTGACDSVHANDDLDISGNPTNIGVTTASGVLHDPPAPDAGGDPHIEIPALDPTEYKQYADYILDSSGNIKHQDGSSVTDPAILNNWDFSAPKWTLHSNSAPGGSYYAEGDMSISGNSGPIAVTLVATGYIEVSGNSEFSNLMNPNDPIDVQNIFMLAGTDVKWNGNANQIVTGLVYAREQIDLSGNPVINGAVLAYDDFAEPETDWGNYPHDQVKENKISGNPTINYGCGLSTPQSSANINILSWNEL